MKKKKAKVDEFGDLPESGWTRTTVVLKEDHLEKLKILSWWENMTVKDLFEDMIDRYLGSKSHLDRLLKERKKNLEERKHSPETAPK